MVRTIGIIGGGLAGLSTAKTLRQFGFSVTVFERETDIGGVWSASRRYPGLTTQNPRETYAFSDWPMPKSYPEWPSGAQMQAYLESYVDHFGFRDAIRLDTEVIAAAPVLGTSRWSVESRVKGQPDTTTETFDVLIVCNGIFSLPAVPRYAGAEAFEAAGGRVLHTSQYTDPELIRGKRLLVVGYGKSSCDVAFASVGVAAATTVVARTLIWKIPKKLGGVLNFKHLLLNRLGEGLFRYIEVRGFEKFFHGPGLPVRNAMMGSVQSVIARQLRLKERGLHPDGKLETIARSTVSLVTDGFYEGVADGSIGFRKAEIVALAAAEARLSTGETVPADVVICGTGWRQRCEFLDAETMAKVTDATGNFRLYRAALPVGVPGLLFNGYNSSFFSQLNAEVGALWIVELVTGALTLPSQADQNRYIDRRLAWMEERTDGKHSKGTNIIPFSVHHMDDMLTEIGLPLPLATRLKHWFVAIDAADYAGLLPRLLKRHRRPVPVRTKRAA